jgi:cytochrome c553
MMPRIDAVLKRIGALAVVGGAVGLTAAMFGLVSITASSGHWAITDWLLHGTMRRAVAVQSLGVSPPPLDDPAMIAEGAGHYEIGCAPCHGQPGAAPPPIPERMTPPPPYLLPRISEWKPRELFFIVKHGVKFTGMPAWPSQQRDDEVWSVVAFLLELPVLDAAAYRELAYGELSDSAHAGGGLPGSASDDARAATDRDPPSAGDDGDTPPAAALCFRCHGADGLGRGIGAFPRLTNLSTEYLDATLQSYASGERPSGIMQPVAASLDAQSLRGVAEYYGRADAAGVERAQLRDAAAAQATLEQGRLIAAEGVAARGVAPCAHCHGPEQVAQNPLFPPLAGQPQRYVERQLEQWLRDGGRGGTPYAEVMSKAVKRLSSEEIEAVAAYYASLPVQP